MPVHVISFNLSLSSAVAFGFLYDELSELLSLVFQPAYVGRKSGGDKFWC
jgi:hypothetical protein